MTAPGSGTCPDCGRRTLYGDHVGMLAGEKCEPSALLKMLRGPKELVRESGKVVVSRIPGTNITITKRRSS